MSFDPNARMTTGRSDAYIIPADMIANRDRREDDKTLSPEDREAFAKVNAEILAKRLYNFCAHGALMPPLSGLPHAVAERFDPGPKKEPKKDPKKEAKKDRKKDPKEDPKKDPKKPQPQTPQDLYILVAEMLPRFPRWPHTPDRMISRSAPLQDMLVYVDGSRSYQLTSDDETESEAVCAVVFKPAQADSIRAKTSRDRGVLFGLESRGGPKNERFPQTNDRAVLRAAVAALEKQKWAEEGRTIITIATDSTYLVEGITDHIGTWRKRDWHDAAGKPVANTDLWVRLLSQVNLYANWGCRVRFWLIPKELNVCAEVMAKSAQLDLEAERERDLVAGKAK